MVEVDYKVFASNQAHFLQIRVEVPLNKPLCQGGQVASPEGDSVKAAYKYERLVGLFFNCGRLGHEANICL